MSGLLDRLRRSSPEQTETPSESEGLKQSDDRSNTPDLEDLQDEYVKLLRLDPDVGPDAFKKVPCDPDELLPALSRLKRRLEKLEDQGRLNAQC